MGKAQSSQALHWRAAQADVQLRPWADQARIGELTPASADKWWRIIPAADVEQVQADALADLMTYAVPWLKARVAQWQNSPYPMRPATRQAFSWGPRRHPGASSIDTASTALPGGAASSGRTSTDHRVAIDRASWRATGDCPELGQISALLLSR
jgi:hypothetical protein